MRSKLVWALVALNVLLAAALVAQFVRPNVALAQAPRASDYIIISGDTTASQSQIIYIIDTENDMLGARTFNGKTVADMSNPISLRRVFSEGVPNNAGDTIRGNGGNRRGPR